MELIYHSHYTKTILIKVLFFFAIAMALISCLDRIYPIDGCDHFSTKRHMNDSELHSVFKELIAGDWLIHRYKILTVGLGSIKAVMVMKKLGFHYAIGVDRKPCASMVKRASIYKLPFKENTFDFVFSMAMLNEVRVPAGMVLEMERVVKPVGVGVVLQRVSGPILMRDVMKAAAPVASYLSFSSIVGVCAVNRTVMVIFQKRFTGDGDLEKVLKAEKASSPLLLATQ